MTLKKTVFLSCVVVKREGGDVFYAITENAKKKNPAHILKTILHLLLEVICYIRRITN